MNIVYRPSVERQSPGIGSVYGSKRNSLLQTEGSDETPGASYVLYDQPPMVRRSRPNSCTPIESVKLLQPQPQFISDPYRHDLNYYVPSMHYHQQPEEVAMENTHGILETEINGDDDDDSMVNEEQKELFKNQHPQSEMFDYDFEDKIYDVVAEKCTKIPTQSVGIYGWRKKVLYLLIVVIVLLVGINAALTYWIISFLGFSSNGISGLDLSSPNDIIFNGKAFFLRQFHTSHISSYNESDSFLRFVSKNGDISFQSRWTTNIHSSSTPKHKDRSNISDIVDNQVTSDSQQVKTPINKQDKTIHIGSFLNITKNKVVLVTDNFEIRDRKQRLVFAIHTSDNVPISEMSDSNSCVKGKAPSHVYKHFTSNEHTMTIRSDHLNVQSINSIPLLSTLQTVNIESGTKNEELRLYSPTSKVLLRGPESVGIESKLGDGSMITYDQLRLKSNGGKIILEPAGGLYIRKLTTVVPIQSNSTSQKNYLRQQLRKPKPVYQLCACQNGKLFLAKPDQMCAIISNRDCQ